MDTSDKVYIKPSYNLDMKVTNSHKHLVKSLYSLVVHQSFETITVKEICDEANVSRSSFYNHFEDKYHLLFFYLKLMRQQLSDKLDFTEDHFVFNDLLRYIQEHAAFFKSLFSLGNCTELTRMLEGAVKEDLQNFLWTRAILAKQESKSSQELQTIFLTGGISSAIQWWVLNDFPLTVEEMEVAINELIVAA